MTEAGGEVGDDLPLGAHGVGALDRRAQALHAPVGVRDRALLLGVGLRGEHDVRELPQPLAERGGVRDDRVGLFERRAPAAAVGQVAQRVDVHEVQRAATSPPLYLLHVDPLRALPDRGRVGAARSTRATTVVAHAAFLTEGLREHATVVFPARVLTPRRRARSRTPTAACSACARRSAAPASAATWQVSPTLAARAGLDLGVLTARMAVARSSSSAVPFYAGLTLEEIGGRGVRWPERDEAVDVPAARRRRPVRPRDPAARAERRTARCASARTARSGRRPRSRSRPR